MKPSNLQFSSSSKSAISHIGCFYFPYLRDGMVTIVSTQATPSGFGLDEDSFIRDIDGDVIYSEEKQDIIDLINQAYKLEQIDPEYRTGGYPTLKADKVAEKSLSVIRFYRNVYGGPVAVVNWDED